ncbi:hypothetical protein CJU89_5018 [Yarrowia sp. B02]|nr:hypothetical protein CJU89_5018 [Yarrowia sp. B02]
MLNLKTMEFQEGSIDDVYVDDKPRKPRYDTRFASRTAECPSKTVVKSKDKDLQVIQENERFVHLAVCARSMIVSECFVDKVACSKEGDVLLFDAFHSSSHFLGNNVIVKMASNGAFVFKLGEMVQISWFDGVETPLLTLSNFYGQIRSEKWQFPPLLETYGGMVYLYYADSVLIPFWGDLGHAEAKDNKEEKSIWKDKPVSNLKLGMKPSMKSIRVTFDFDRRLPEELTLSTDRRFLVSHSRVVADLATAKTYIVKDPGEFEYNSMVFAGRKNDKPQFYRWSTLYSNYFNKYIHRMEGDPEGTMKWFLEKSKVARGLKKLVYRECSPGFSLDQKEKSGSMVLKAMKKH